MSSGLLGQEDEGQLEHTQCACPAKSDNEDSHWLLPRVRFLVNESRHGLVRVYNNQKIRKMFNERQNV